MSDCYVVSFFLDEIPDESLNMSFGIGLLPNIYELMTNHKKLLFLVPYGCASSKSIMETVRNLSASHTDVQAQCWAVCSCSIAGFYEKMANEKTKNFDRCVLFKDFGETPLRQGRIMRNKKMVELSDLSIFYINKRNGRVHNTLKYAKEAEKEYIIFKLPIT